MVVFLPLVAAAATVLLLTVWARRHLVLVTVVGDSMSPTYRSGEKVLVRRVAHTALRTGDVIVIAKPRFDGRWTWTRTWPFPQQVNGYNSWIIKRVAAVTGDPIPTEMRVTVPTGATVPAASLVVIGDNPASFDSRSLGFFPANRVLGKVIRPVRPLVK